MFQKLQQRFRGRRMRWFEDTFRGAPIRTVLDVGGTAEIWLAMRHRPHVTLMNVQAPGERAAGFTYVTGDGSRLPFADQSFDIVFSNSVIEHVGDGATQSRFASEAMRVGRRFWVQTPNRWFPVEQHMLTPFVHLMPRVLSALIVRRFTVWQWTHKPTEDRRQSYVEHFLRDIRLLTATDMRRLFPGAQIRKERFLLFTKSLIAWKND